MKTYVLVVPFSMDLARVALLQKQRRGPACVVEKLNFPGGKVEPGETPEAAAVRELKEEMALEVDIADLERIEFRSKAGDYALYVYAARVPNFEAARTMTDEVVVVLTVDALREGIRQLPEFYVADMLPVLELALLTFPQFA